MLGSFPSFETEKRAPARTLMARADVAEERVG